MKNKQKFPRLRSGHNGTGKYQFDFALNQERTKFLSFVIGKPLEGFLGFILKASANGLALGIALWFFQLSLSFTDEEHNEKTVYQYGVFIKHCIVVYLPQRYILWEQK